jgi:transglutaminase-like putative cysteine protease
VRSLVSFAALVVLLLAGPALAEREVRYEALAIAMGGHEVGTTFARDVETKDGYRFERNAKLRIVRGAARLEIETKTTGWTDRDLRPLRWRFEKKDAAGTMVSEGEVKGGKVLLRTTQAGATVNNEVAAPAGLMLASSLEHRLRRDAAKLAGKPAQTFPVLVEDMGAVTTMKVKVERDGKGFRLKTTLATMETTDRIDAAGRTILSETPALAAIAYPLGSPPPKAVKAGDIDVLARSTWKAPRLSSDVRRVRYRVYTPDAKSFEVPEDDRQRVTKRTSKYVEIEVTDAPSLNSRLPLAERAKALAATPYEPITDPRLKSAFVEATNGAHGTRQRVAALTRWVYDHVDAKGLDRGYAPALATLQSRAGDCTEHSVLLSALLRSAGIPTRLVDGVVVDGGRAGYHEWVEVEIDGQVIPADPTFGQFPASPARLKLAEGSSSPEGLLALGVAAGRLLRPGVRVEVVDADPKPR